MTESGAVRLLNSMWDAEKICSLIFIKYCNWALRRLEIHSVTDRRNCVIAGGQQGKAVISVSLDLEALLSLQPNLNDQRFAILKFDLPLDLVKLWRRLARNEVGTPIFRQQMNVATSWLEIHSVAAWRNRVITGRQLGEAVISVGFDLGALLSSQLNLDNNRLPVLIFDLYRGVGVGVGVGVRFSSSPK